MRIGQFHPVCKNIQRGAQRSDDGCDYAISGIHPVADGNRVILAYDLTKVS